ncbi:hypothetical protein GCM10027610_048820 [Dactylosporangium cerinum]
MAPIWTRPEPSIVVVATLLLLHSDAWVPDGGTGVPVAVRIAPLTTVNWEAGAAAAPVGGSTAAATTATAASLMNVDRCMGGAYEPAERGPRIPGEPRVAVRRQPAHGGTGTVAG